MNNPDLFAVEKFKILFGNNWQVKKAVLQDGDTTITLTFQKSDGVLLGVIEG